jgi:hypothetical protein
MSSVNLMEKLLDAVEVEWTALGIVTLPMSTVSVRDGICCLDDQVA